MKNESRVTYGVSKSNNFHNLCKQRYAIIWTINFKGNYLLLLMLSWNGRKIIGSSERVLITYNEYHLNSCSKIWFVSILVLTTFRYLLLTLKMFRWWYQFKTLYLTKLIKSLIPYSTTYVIYRHVCLFRKKTSVFF